MANQFGGVRALDSRLPLITPEQKAAELGCSVPTVFRRARAGEIVGPIRREGRSWFYSDPLEASKAHVRAKGRRRPPAEQPAQLPAAALADAQALLIALGGALELAQQQLRAMQGQAAHATTQAMCRARRVKREAARSAAAAAAAEAEAATG